MNDYEYGGHVIVEVGIDDNNMKRKYQSPIQIENLQCYWGCNKRKKSLRHVKKFNELDIYLR